MGSLTVGTFNVWRSGEPWRYALDRGIVRGAIPGSAAVTMRPERGVWSRRLPLIADALRKAEFDIVGLQEVLDEDGGEPAGDALASRLGMSHAGEPDSQLAVLTPHRIRSWTTVSLSSTEAREEAKRGYGAARILHAVVATPGGDTNVVVAHWSPRSAAARIGAARALVDYLAGLPLERLVVVGDLNTVDRGTPELAILSQGARPLVDAWAAIHPDRPGPTMPSHDSVVRLDYVFLSRDLAPVEARLFGGAPDCDGFYPSDHLGVRATAELT
ncbi:endonuclease/exonuclease/phosphatase family protein [Tenggerimyces flavus]|uniref:Endonuclease/exonuclease/phosphatase family protein n=1 Tax=Tenggerimyces flavus TaxID=1708749 RepID=A0ABV7Y6Y4_9ACTN|nr:endonuclease/exonuclease/phosphatase family protein [Tenggerimyces flavus]MBM7791140.1 endonuclease/exonuclease/phosphatase family metal-dependent hydrolase [Tenggerimyces flavus]